MTATLHDSVTYFQPNLAVDGAGRVAISAFALANGRIDEVLLVSPPHQLRFGAPLRVTTAPFDPHSRTATGQKHSAWWIGDYQGITASDGAFQLVWNDTRTCSMDRFAATVRPWINAQAPAGSRSVNRAPPVGDWSHVTVPPCDSIVRRTIASPRPVPPRGLRGRRTNGSKIRSR